MSVINGKTVQETRKGKISEGWQKDMREHKSGNEMIKIKIELNTEGRKRRKRIARLG